MLRSGLLAVVLLGVCTALPAAACTVPVYQWARENWIPDTYGVYVFHEGELPEEQQAVVTQLEEAIQPPDGGAAANMAVHTVDVARQPLEGEPAIIWDKHRPESFPRVVVCFPMVSPPFGPVWSGPLDSEAVAMVADSPVRQSIAERLQDGAPACWVFLDSGNADEDDAKFAVLEDELTKRGEETNAYMPVVRLRRDDAKEQVLVDMLLRTEPDLLEFEEPMAFPVFGRGRALYALIGAGINEDTIRDAFVFLMSACSCVVKDENPGADLLMRADWTTMAEAPVLFETELPAVDSATDSAAVAESAPMLPPAAADAVEDLEKASSPLLAYAILATVAAFAVLVTVTVLLTRRANQS